MPGQHKKTPRLTKEQRQALLDYQGGGCGICGRKDRKIVVDHDHENGKFRGLICGLCNSGMGMLGDNRPAILRVLRYLGATPLEIVYIPKENHRTLYLKDVPAPVRPKPKPKDEPARNPLVERHLEKNALWEALRYIR